MIKHKNTKDGEREWTVGSWKPECGIFLWNISLKYVRKISSQWSTGIYIHRGGGGGGGLPYSNNLQIDASAIYPTGQNCVCVCVGGGGGSCNCHKAQRGILIAFTKLLLKAIYNNVAYRPIYIGKTQIKTWGFCCTVYTARKTNIQVFWHEKRMREKTRISYWFFGKWCACANLWPYVVALRRGPRYSAEGYVPCDHETRIIPARLHWQKNPEKPAEFQKILLRRWVFRFEVFRGSCLATSQLNVRKILLTWH